MIVDIREFDEAGGRLTATDATTVEDPVAGDVRVPCTVELEYRPSGGGFYFHARVEATLASVCQRCLAPAHATLRGEFDLVVRRGDHRGDEGEDVVVLAPHEYEVALDPYIHETVVVSMPMIVVCDEACRGLCPVCGANRNTDPCACREPADGRWDGLKKMK